MILPDIIHILLLSGLLQQLCLLGKLLGADGQRGAFQGVDVDGVIRPACGFIVRGDFRLFFSALLTEHLQHFQIEIFLTGTVIQPHLHVDAGTDKSVKG